MDHQEFLDSMSEEELEAYFQSDAPMRRAQAARYWFERGQHRVDKEQIMIAFMSIFHPEVSDDAVIRASRPLREKY